LPDDIVHDATLIDQSEPPRPKTVRARHAASIIVLRPRGEDPEMLMGMRGSKHRFMPNRLVFPGGAVDRADLSAPCATEPPPHAMRHLRKATNARLAHGLAIAAARELEEETGLSLGTPPALDGIEYLCRAVTPTSNPIRFNARFLVVSAERLSGTLGGSGELENLRYYGLHEALALDLALPTRMVMERLRAWLAMAPEERIAQTHTPILRRHAWRME
jgi:8-oxo-dGTP pyrophosphatase MutT (NUDIX family)